VTAILVRIAWVMSYNAFVRFKNRHWGVDLPRPMMTPTVQSGLVISWCGMRGIVTLATALALPMEGMGRPGFPYRDLLLFAAFCVVLGTLVIQGLTLRPLMLLLRIRGDHTVEDEVHQARIETSQAALDALKKEAPSEFLNVVRQEYEGRLRLDYTDGKYTEKQNSELARLQRHALTAERNTLWDLRRSGRIGDDAFHTLEGELDRAEIRL
jgi:CPA1 family monovalent cation:H+ antiporter